MHIPGYSSDCVDYFSKYVYVKTFSFFGTVHSSGHPYYKISSNYIFSFKFSCNIRLPCSFTLFGLGPIS